MKNRKPALTAKVIEGLALLTRNGDLVNAISDPDAEARAVAAGTITRCDLRATEDAVRWVDAMHHRLIVTRELRAKERQERERKLRGKIT